MSARTVAGSEPRLSVTEYPRKFVEMSSGLLQLRTRIHGEHNPAPYVRGDSFLRIPAT